MNKRTAVLCSGQSRRGLSAALFALGISPLAYALPPADLYTLIDLGTLGGARSTAYDINNNGQIVGDAETATGVRAFITDPGGTTLRALGTLGGSNSSAVAINAQGQVVGSALISGDAAVHAFVSDGLGAPLIDLTPGVAGNTGAADINARGIVVGNVFESGFGFPLNHPFVADAHGILGILSEFDGTARAINDDGVIAGQHFTSRFFDGYPTLWKPNPTVSDFPQNYHSSTEQALTDPDSFLPRGVAVDINARGQLVGTLNGGGFITAPGIGPRGGVGVAEPLNINDLGQVVGRGGHPTDIFLIDAHLDTGAGVAVDLNQLPGLPRRLVSANAINDLGQIVGTDDNHHAFLLTVHPHWTAVGDGAWDAPENWDFGGFGAFAGLTPGRPHAVVIEAPAGAVIAGPAQDTQIQSLRVGGASAPIELRLGTGAINPVAGTVIAAHGTVVGHGTLHGEVSIEHGGRLLSDAPALELVLDGRIVNHGRIEAVGDPRFQAVLTSQGTLFNFNDGVVSVHSGVVRFSGDLVNAGQLLLRGNNILTGGINNLPGADIHVLGDFQRFFGAVFNHGRLTVDQDASVEFNAAVSGAGAFGGAGRVTFQSVYEAGFSDNPISIQHDESVFFSGSSSIEMDIGGVTPGNCIGCSSQLIFNNDVSFQNAALRLSAIQGYRPRPGDRYQLFLFNGTHSGEFGRITLPDIADGLAWDVSELSINGALSVRGSLAAIPLPTPITLLLPALAGLVWRGRHRVRAR